MPLPSTYAEMGLHDISHRLQGSIISFDNKPVVVYGFNTSKVPYNIKALTAVNFNPFEASVADPAWSVKGLGRTLGMFNMSPGIVGRMMRHPLRSMTQGIHPTNSRLVLFKEDLPPGDIYADFHSTPFKGCVSVRGFPSEYFSEDIVMRIKQAGQKYALKYEMLIPLAYPGFVSMFSGTHDPVSLSGFKAQTVSPMVAVSKDFALEKDKFGQAYLNYRGSRIGLFLDDEIRLLPDKVYLSETIERTLGFRAA